MADPSDYGPGFPRELWPAVDRLHAWMQRLLLADQELTTPTNPLYHYTDEAGFRGILRSEEIWCFSHLHQTDRSEFSYSLDIAREVLQEIGKSEEWFEKNFAICLLDLIQSNSFTDAFEFYLFSVSQHRDDPQQWETFGKNGEGYAIGFAPNLFVGDRTELSEFANQNAFVGKVLYGEGAIRARHEYVFRNAAKVVREFAIEHEELVRRHKPVVYLAETAKQLIAEQLVWNCLTGKHQRFSNEREVRFLLLGIPGRFASFRQVHNGKPYVPSPLPLKTPTNVSQILIGNATPAGSEDVIAKFLIYHGYNYDIPIIRSRA